MLTQRPEDGVFISSAQITAHSSSYLKKPGLTAQSTKESYSSKSKDIVLKYSSGNKSEKSSVRIELVFFKGAIYSYDEYSAAFHQRAL